MNGCWHLAVNVCLAVMNPVEDVRPPLKGDALQNAKLNKNVHILTGRAQKMQSLKVLSREMDLPESGSFRREVQRLLENLPLIPPSCESPLKIPRHLVQLLAIRILIPIVAMKIHCAVGIGKTWCIAAEYQYTVKYE